jgi:hypothetical protein
MKKLTLIMLSAVAGTAFAGSYSDDVNTAEYSPEYVNEQDSASNEGPYVGAAIGWTKQLASGANSPTSRDYFGGQANVGYAFQLKDKFYVGPELGWGYYGQSDPGNVKTTAVDLMAVAQYYFKDKMNVIAKAGVAETAVSQNSDTDNYTRAMTGVGAGYDIMPQLNLNVTYYKIFGNQDQYDNVNSVFAGATYRF